MGAINPSHGIWSLKQRDKMLHLRPILHAKRWFRRKAILDKAIADQTMLVPAEIDRIIRKDDRKDMRETYKRLGVFRLSSFAPMAQIPVWLAVMESLRGVTGAEGGILTVLHRLYNPAGHDFTIPLEESMATEGGLWFPNLLISDPHLALPIILAGVMYTNVTWGWKVATKEEILAMPIGAARRASIFRALKKVFQTVAISLAPSTLAAGIPSGLLLYWISSTTFATLQTRAFAKFWPPPTIPAQCANYGVAPAALPDATTRWQLIPKTSEPAPASMSSDMGSKKPTKTVKPKRQIKRYVKS
ncbi:hypothetical protein KEM54_006520 [Ascosphaera aggregata]|nr:hypothetical protein KEM54_006520 [Ascosphaera aggregata]